MRLLVRYNIPKYKESGIVGVDLPDYDYMSAVDIQGAIEAGICDQYNNVSDSDFVIDTIEYLGARKMKPTVPVQSPLNITKTCLACGGDHGNSGLPCPKMTPSAKLL